MLYLGVMSGTSCDGIDVALVDFSSGIHTIATSFTPFPNDLRSQLLAVINQQPLTIQQFSDLDAKLGQLYAQAINQLMHKQALKPKDIHAIGLHGQTLYHDPNSLTPNTLQWGSAATVAQQTGILTVSNFRQMDVAHGGQGAPLAPAFHQHVFRNFDEPFVVLNLGGIANITLIDGDQVVGFDTGPASCLMDEWIQKHLDKDFDANGEWAQQGEVNQTLLDDLLLDPYFNLAYPKSTGRELFNLNWLLQHRLVHELSPVDVQRTLLHFTVESIHKGISQLNKRVSKVIVCGGGSHNYLLLDHLSTKLQIKVEESGAYGVDPDFMEAALMAWMAKQHIDNSVLDLSDITGAKSAFVYGVKHVP